MHHQDALFISRRRLADVSVRKPAALRITRPPPATPRVQCCGTRGRSPFFFSVLPSRCQVLAATPPAPPNIKPGGRGGGASQDTRLCCVGGTRWSCGGAKFFPSTVKIMPDENGAYSCTRDRPGTWMMCVKPAFRQLVSLPWYSLPRCHASPRRTQEAPEGQAAGRPTRPLQYIVR